MRVDPAELAAPYFSGQELLDATAALRTLVTDRRACLELSQGRLADLHHYVHQAKLDFRDVLYWADSYGE